MIMFHKKNNFWWCVGLILCVASSPLWAQDEPLTSSIQQDASFESPALTPDDWISIEEGDADRGAPLIPTSDSTQERKFKPVIIIKCLAVGLGITVSLAAVLYYVYGVKKPQDVDSIDMPVDDDVLRNLLERYNATFSEYMAENNTLTQDRFENEDFAEGGVENGKSDDMPYRYCYGNELWNCHHCLDCADSLIAAHRNWCMKLWKCAKPNPNAGQLITIGLVSVALPVIAGTLDYLVF